MVSRAAARPSAEELLRRLEGLQDAFGAAVEPELLPLSGAATPVLPDEPSAAGAALER